MGKMNRTILANIKVKEQENILFFTYYFSSM